MIRVTGVKELDRLLRALPKEVTHQVLSAANAAAAKPLVEREKLLAPEGPTGNLVDSIGVVRTPIKRANILGEATVGPRRKRPYRGQAGHLVEFGTKKRKLKGRGQYKAGTNRGVMPAKPFARPAFRQTKDAVLSGIKEQIAKKLVSRMKRELGSAFIR